MKYSCVQLHTKHYWWNRSALKNIAPYPVIP